MELAKMAVEETGRGIYEDKITKNMFATEYIYHSIKYEKTVGVIKENEEEIYIQYKKIKESTNIRRLITGTLAGIGQISIVLNVIIYIVSLFN